MMLVGREAIDFDDAKPEERGLTFGDSFENVTYGFILQILNI